MAGYWALSELEIRLISTRPWGKCIQENMLTVKRTDRRMNGWMTCHRTSSAGS